MNQDQAFSILAMGSNVLLTGAAGSGKTYLVNRFIRHCHEHSIDIAITASTGIAATHIGGMTVHSWSGMGIRESLSDDEIEELISREYLAKRYARTSVLIIDEISMLSGNFLAGLDRLLRSARVSSEVFGGIQIVLVGDFFQLPPVSRGAIEYAFEHPIWSRLELTPCVLTTQFRQATEMAKDPLLEILTEIRKGEVSATSRALLRSRDVPVLTSDHTELFTRNQAVDEYNMDRLLVLPGEDYVYYMESRGAEKFTDALKKGCLAPETLTLRKGARVMFVKNNLEEGYVNGLIGHIIGTNHDVFPVVQLLSGHEVVAKPTEWSIEENGKIKASIEQLPLRLAWAITVHKSQGLTLDTAVINLLDAFVPGQGYVALSRVRTLEGLILRGFNEISLMVENRVIDFDKRLQRESERVVEFVESFTSEELQKSIHAGIVRLGGVIEKKNLAVGGAVSASKTATHLETYALIQKGMSLEEIAFTRNLKISTIFTHFEKLIDEKKVIDLTRYRPADETRLRNIHEAFIELATLDLTPVRKHLYEVYEEEYGYDEIRVARLFLSEEDLIAIEQAS